MKLVKLLTITAVLALIAGTSVRAGEGEDKGEGKGPRGGHGPAMEHLLPPHAVEDLNLTADQKTKLDDLESSFKKDAAAWDKAHPTFRDDMRKARESGDKEAMHTTMEQRKSLMDTRKSYVDKLRASLTDEQKAKLDKSIEEAKKRMGKGGPRGEKGEKGPKPPED